MATVRNTLMMRDAMGSVLKNTITTMNMTISTMERLNAASDNIDLSHDFELARQQIGRTTAELNIIDDEIRKAAKEQENFNNKIRDGTQATGSLKSMLMSLGGILGIKKIIETSDSMTLITARLNLINDGLQTTNELQNMIFKAADDARGLYIDMAASVSKLGLLAGDAFNSNAEVVKFVELFQKMSIVSGSSSSEIRNAMYQLNQALASGRLQGDEFRSIIENAPMLAQAISDYMQIGRDELKKMSSEGLITASIIKGAMFSVADEVNAKFKQMPMTWGQVWNGMVNYILMLSQPILRFISFLANNWETLEPIILIVVSALGAYAIMVAGINTLNAIAALHETMKAAALTISTGATLKATAAQHGLNAALLANPTTWIIIGIVAAIVLVIYSLIKWQETTANVVGFIFGLFGGLYSFVYNIIAGGYNLLASFADFLMNLFIDPVAAIKVLFLDLAITVLGYLDSLAVSLIELVNLIPGVEITASSGFEGWIDSLQKMKDEIVNDKGLVSSNRWDNISMNEMADKFYTVGYDLSLGASDKLTGIFDKMSGLTDWSIDDLMSGLQNEEFNVNVKDDVNLADESLKYLLDAVTQRYINNVNLTAPAPTVTVQFMGDINRDVDLDELAEQTKQKLGTEMVEYAMASTDISY